MCFLATFEDKTKDTLFQINGKVPTWNSYQDAYSYAASIRLPNHIVYEAYNREGAIAQFGDVFVPAHAVVKA